MKSLVSVIIPMHNLERHIEATLNSAIGQDHDNIQIIAVDDASSDNTLDIAKATLQSSKRDYKIIKLDKNMGVSFARNRGIGEAIGDFILFWDGDDLADKNFISILYKAITSVDNCDLAFSGYRTREESNGVEVTHPIDMCRIAKITPQQLTAQRITNKIDIHVCTILYRRNYINRTQLMFSSGCGAGEDIEFMLKSFATCSTFAASPECPYIYIYHSLMGSRNESNTPIKRLSRYEQNAKAHRRTYEYLQKTATENELVKIVKHNLLQDTILRELTVFAGKNDKESFLKYLDDPKIRRELSSYNVTTGKLDILLKSILALHFPKTYYEYRKNKF